MRKIINGESITLGVCYYPEHWEEACWERDLERMQENGIHTIRIGEFAWSIIEPREGVFCFEFFDRFLDLTDQMGMKVILGTPTAAPPVWLTERYPEALNVRQDGVKFRHGGRRHYNYNSPKYQELVKRIVEQMASHYGKRKSVIGWQIDNELNCEVEVFYSECDTQEFRKFLKNRYGSVEALNSSWGTVFWNQTYTDWQEVHVPRITPAGAINPHQALDYLRFVSDSACRFAGMQSEIIRRHVKEHDFITTNGVFPNLDLHRLTDDSLDFITYDSYPNFAYCIKSYEPEDSMKDRKWSRNLAEVRSMSGNFGIMEQQSGANGSNRGMEAPTPKPGQIALWTMQSIAHGADFVCYFRWRTAVFGSEIYWHGILDYSGRENRRLKEVHGISQKLEKIREAAGSRYEAWVGVIRDYDNVWDAQMDVWHGKVEEASRKSIFESCQKSHTPFDYCYLDHLEADDLSGYRVLFCPHAAIMTEERTKLLEEYVRRGGILVFGCRNGYKDGSGQCIKENLPGLLKGLTGTDIPEYTMISPEIGETIKVDWQGVTIELGVFSEILEPEGSGETEGVYLEDYYAGSPAVIHNRFGRGEVFYFGGAFTESAVDCILDRLGVKSPYEESIILPEKCELAVREKEGTRYIFVLNYDRNPAEIQLRKQVADLWTGESVSGPQMIEGYGTRVYRM